jgi:DNA-binding LytR/AlgR family response regulator
MLRIALCDNDKTDLKTLLAQTDIYLAAHPRTEGVLYSFYEPMELAQCISRGLTFDVYILDILMPKTNGIELGRMIREKDPFAPIIYTTSSEEFALNAFENHAIRYLVKPVRQAELESALDFAVSLCTDARPGMYMVKTGEGITALSSDKIMCVENSDRTAVYSLSGGDSVSSIKIRGSFEDAVSPLPEDPMFIRPHKSFFVNMRFIQSLSKDSITLDDGRSIPVSRRCCQDITGRYLKFLSEGGAGRK